MDYVAPWIDPGAIARRSGRTALLHSHWFQNLRIVQAFKIFRSERTAELRSNARGAEASSAERSELERCSIFSALFEHRSENGKKQNSGDDAQRHANRDFIKVGKQHLRADETEHER